jgi:hypothetical protein
MSLRDTPNDENKKEPLPSPLWGRGWTATGVFTSRRGPGEGVATEIFGTGHDFSRAEIQHNESGFSRWIGRQGLKPRRRKDAYGTAEAMP